MSKPTLDELWDNGRWATDDDRNSTTLAYCAGRDDLARVIVERIAKAFDEWETCDVFSAIHAIEDELRSKLGEGSR